MPRNPQTTTAFTVSLPVPMARQIERARKAEYRSRSELTREAFRVYFPHIRSVWDFQGAVGDGGNG